MLSRFFNQSEASSAETPETLFHLVAEEERKKYICDHPGCGKVFRYKSEIVRHTATHSESRPFVCQYDNCFKAFKRNDALENHVRSSHTRETPFECPFPECGAKFTTHGSFRYHVLKHNKQGFDVESVISGKESIHTDAPPQRKQVKLDPLSEKVMQAKQKDPAFLQSEKDSLADSFFAPIAPRFASKIQWEMKNDETECASPLQKSEDQQVEKFNQMVEENKMLKQKLQTSEKIIKSMQKQINDLLGNLFEYQSQMDNLPSKIDFTSLPSMRETFLPPSSPEKSSSEELMFDFANYGENMNFLSALESTPKLESSSVDAFLSFGQEANSFGF